MGGPVGAYGASRAAAKQEQETGASSPTVPRAAWSSALIEKFKLDISREESQQLLVKYDMKNNGKFAYCDFIQSCVLLLKAKETSLMRRMRIQNADKMVGVSAQSPRGPEPGSTGGAGSPRAAGYSPTPISSQMPPWISDCRSVRVVCQGVCLHVG